MLAEEAQHERCRANDCSVDAARLLTSERRILAAQAKQVAMKRDRPRVLIHLRRVELAAGERGHIVRGGDDGPIGGGLQTWKLCEKLDSSVVDAAGELGLMIREVEERCSRREFLPLKEHGRAG